MRLATIEQFRQDCFAEGSAPDPRTVRRWIDDGVIDGKRVGSTYYVDLDSFALKTGNVLADRVLNDATA